MKVTIREENETGTAIRLRADNLRIGDYVTPKEGLLETMQVIERDIKRLGETCEFVLID